MYLPPVAQVSLFTAPAYMARLLGTLYLSNRRTGKVTLGDSCHKLACLLSLSGPVFSVYSYAS